MSLPPPLILQNFHPLNIGLQTRIWRWKPTTYIAEMSYTQFFSIYFLATLNIILAIDPFL